MSPSHRLPEGAAQTALTLCLLPKRPPLLGQPHPDLPLIDRGAIALDVAERLQPLQQRRQGVGLHPGPGKQALLQHRIDDHGAERPVQIGSARSGEFVLHGRAGDAQRSSDLSRVHPVVGEPQHLLDLSHGQLSPGWHPALLVVEDRDAAVADPRMMIRRRYRLPGGRHQIGTLAGFASEWVAGFRRNTHDLSKAEAATACVRGSAPAGGRLDLIELDLASLASVRACADALLADGSSFRRRHLQHRRHGCPTGLDGRRVREPVRYQSSGPLRSRELECIPAPSGGRLVMVASSAHRVADVDLDDPNSERAPYEPMAAYSRSKTGNTLFAVESDRRHRMRRVRATALHPGSI